MGVVIWILQVVVFLVLWKVVHLVFWNLRKMVGSRSLILTMVITLLIAVLAVIGTRAWHTSWAEVVTMGIIVGLANGEYEYNRSSEH